jgi:hypothetical protein
MSFTNLKYDACSYQTNLAGQSTALSWTMDPSRFEHCDPCMNKFGLVGGTAVGHIKGNLVDLENDLRGANRPNTHCPAYKYLPTDGTYVQGKEYIKPVKHPRVDTRMQHLPSCQMIDYAPVPAEPAWQQPTPCRRL